MIANVHLYFYDEGSIEARVETIQIDVLSVTHLTNAADLLKRYIFENGELLPRENHAIHVNFEFA